MQNTGIPTQAEACATFATDTSCRLLTARTDLPRRESGPYRLDRGNQRCLWHLAPSSRSSHADAARALVRENVGWPRRRGHVGAAAGANQYRPGGQEYRAELSHGGVLRSGGEYLPDRARLQIARRAGPCPRSLLQSTR